MTTAQRGLEIERMTNLILFELLEKPIKLWIYRRKQRGKNSTRTY
jgi:hypothetical protein